MERDLSPHNAQARHRSHFWDSSLVLGSPPTLLWTRSADEHVRCTGVRACLSMEGSLPRWISQALATMSDESVFLLLKSFPLALRKWLAAVRQVQILPVSGEHGTEHLRKGLSGLP
jgi:hypothetical protein